MRLILRREISEDVHAGGVVPDEEGLAVLLGLVHEAIGVADQHLVKGLHVVLGFAPLLPVLQPVILGNGAQWAFIHNPSVCRLRPSAASRWVVRVGRPAVGQIARAGFVDPVLRIIEPVGVGHGIEVVEIAKEFVEAMHAREILIQVAEVVLAKLAGFVALGL